MVYTLVEDAIIYACSLGLLACGVNLIYTSTKTFNFSHGCMSTWGVYIIFSGVAIFGVNLYYFFPIAFLLGALLGVICYICINGPLLRRQAKPVTLMMSTLGFDLILYSGIQIYADFLTYTFKLYPRMISMRMYDFIIGEMRAATIVAITLTTATIMAFYIFMSKTKLGIAVRAISENPSLTALSGVRPDKVYLTAWILGGGLACIGGAMMSLVVTGTPVMGWLVIISVFAASIVGGVNSVYGGIMGGFIIGLAEFLGSYLLTFPLGSWILQYKPIISLIAMTITLMVLPTGLVGIKETRLAKKFKKLTISSRGGEI
jgi:branched-chain amino acid transport system permease protein